MLGQPASSHTVCRPPVRTRAFSSVNWGPIRALVRIHGGLDSIGVSALRTSSRSSLRPSEFTPAGVVVTWPLYAPADTPAGVAELHGGLPTCLAWSSATMRSAGACQLR